MAAYLLTNKYTYTASADIPAGDDCLNYYRSVFVTKLKDSAVGVTLNCKSIFDEADLKVELVEDLTPKVDTSDAVGSLIHRIYFIVA